MRLDVLGRPELPLSGRGKRYRLAGWGKRLGSGATNVTKGKNCGSIAPGPVATVEIPFKIVF